MKIGDIVRLNIHGLEKASSEEVVGISEIEWNPEADLLFLSDLGPLVLTPREVSGMRLFINGSIEQLEAIQKSKVIINALNKIAKATNCKLLQIQTEQTNYSEQLQNGFYCSNLILEKKLSKNSESISEYTLNHRRLDSDRVNEYSIREYITRLLVPGGTPAEDDSFSLVVKEYEELCSLDIEGIEFREYFTEEYGKNVYFIWFINSFSKEAIRCFSWCEPHLRGQGIIRKLNLQIAEELGLEGIEKAMSFTSVSNISQIKTSLRVGYQLNKVVISREVL